MNKDILMLVCGETNWRENHHRAESILGPVKVISGESNMISSFQKCRDAATTDLFVLIDGDNWLLGDAKTEIEDANHSTVFFSTNQWGIRYGHGGVKVLSKDSQFSGLAVDVTERLALRATPRVISVHAFNYSPYSQWRTIFKELLKLTLWGNDTLLSCWLEHQLPKSIYDHNVIPYMRNTTVDKASQLLLNNIGLELEFQRAKSIDAEGMFSLLHMNDHPCEVEGY